MVRTQHHVERIHQLQQSAMTILQELTLYQQQQNQHQQNQQRTITNHVLLTTEERRQVKLAQWQRALDLYVYSPSHVPMNMMGLLEQLLQGLYSHPTS